MSYLVIIIVFCLLFRLLNKHRIRYELLKAETKFIKLRNRADILVKSGRINIKEPLTAFVVNNIGIAENNIAKTSFWILLLSGYKYRHDKTRQQRLSNIERDIAKNKELKSIYHETNAIIGNYLSMKSIFSIVGSFFVILIAKLISRKIVKFRKKVDQLIRYQILQAELEYMPSTC